MERHNPLLDPRPDDPIDQIHAYAQDLAYLTLYGDYPSVMLDLPTNEIFLSKQEIANNFNRKWGGFVHEKYLTEEQIKTALGRRTEYADKEGHIVEIRKVNPSLALLESWDYLQVRPPTKERQQHTYKLTTKAFQLLEKPSRPPSIFISYRRQESSAFALLIEARLQLKGGSGVFIDRDIPGGELWEQHIRTQIASSSVFVALLGKTALDADSWVARELEWADQAMCRIIPIWHNGRNLATQKKFGEVPDVLHERQSYTLKEESALEYDTAIIWLLNTLGYRS